MVRIHTERWIQLNLNYDAFGFHNSSKTDALGLLVRLAAIPKHQFVESGNRKHQNLKSRDGLEISTLLTKRTFKIFLTPFSVERRQFKG